LYALLWCSLSKCFFPFVRNVCGALCQSVFFPCTKLLWCSLSKCCFPLYETSVVLFVRVLFPFVRNFCGAPCQNVVSLCMKRLWCSLSECFFPLVRNFCGAPCQNVVSLCMKLVLLLFKVLFPKSINNFFVYFTFPFYGRNSDSLRTGRSGDRISVEKRFSVPFQTGPKPIQPPRQLMPGIARGQSGQGVLLTNHSFLALR
jgi:hypothetical protein